MVNPIVQHHTSGALAPELHRNFVISARSKILQILISFLSNVRVNLSNLVCLVCVSRRLLPSEMIDAHTSLCLCHILQIDTIVLKRVLSRIDQLSFHRHSHVSFTQARIHLFPVKMLLEDDGLYAGWKNTVL